MITPTTDSFSTKAIIYISNHKGVIYDYSLTAEIIEHWNKHGIH